MKSLGTKALVLLFVVLVIQCAFDGLAQSSAASPPRGESTFCGSLNAASVETAVPVHSVPHPPSGETIGLLPVISPLWFLAQSIDHPPEQPA